MKKETVTLAASTLGVAALLVALAAGGSRPTAEISKEATPEAEPLVQVELPPIREEVVEAFRIAVPPDAPAGHPGDPTIQAHWNADGQYVIENHPVTLRYADGRVVERRVRIVATPVRKKLDTLKRDLKKAPQKKGTEPGN